MKQLTTLIKYIKSSKLVQLTKLYDGVKPKIFSPPINNSNTTIKLS
jgi:hypothetical protein